MRVLFIGESWTVSQTVSKGIDVCHSSSYVEYGGVFLDALKREGLEVDYMPCDKAQREFPFEAEALTPYAAVILSDIGSNNFLLHPDTQKSLRLPNRLAVLKEYIASGGGLLTCGGYLSYSGIDGKARYGMTPLSEAIAVDMLHYDDRMETPEGVVPEILRSDHPVLSGMVGAQWPFFLGYNKVLAKPNSDVIAVVGEDVFMSAMEFGSGRSFAFASDCVPHWAPPGFVLWEHYGRLFHNIIRWLAKEI